MVLKKVMLPLVAGIVLSSCSLFQKTSKKTSTTKHDLQAAISRLDSTKRTIRSYKEIITDKAITRKGLFTVHKVDERYYFEIPDSMLDRDMLVVNRISKGGTLAPYLGGDQIGEAVIKFCKEPNNKVLIKQQSFIIRSGDSSENGMMQSVENSNFQPIVAAFDIKTVSQDSTAVVIDMTDYINSDNSIFSFNKAVQGVLYADRPSGYQTDKSFIKEIRPFPINLEIKAIKTFARSVEGFQSYEINNSIVLLPKEPMRPRCQDKRVGYFAKGYYNYEYSRPVDINWMITRWRLEPKDEDIEKYKRGELVNPKKPIVYYIDPATPKNWIPYLIQGVNDWQPAFEKAGFKNAIYALEAPTNDSTWSLDDARHNAIVYKATPIQNASGPHVGDPRSGEILESHINWFHNIQELMHNWYMVQAGPNDPAARRMQFDDSVMGRLIRYVCSHEVGHTLGLRHNFGASSTVPVDSIRSKHYVEVNGFCPSIMDYARFNYIAQPEDSLEPKDLIPKLGVYDYWAIEWGYKWFPDLKTKDQEKSFLNDWVTQRLEKDKHLWFGDEVLPPEQSWNPKSQSEDIGDDAMQAGYYGILNLKRVNASLKEWTKESNKDYTSLQKINQEVVLQYQRYLYHVANNIGGRTWIQKNVEQSGEGAYFPSKEKQKAAVRFLQDELFSTPAWLLDNDIYRLSAARDMGSLTLGSGNIYRLFNLQATILTRISSYHTYDRLLSQQTTITGKSYTVDELLTDLEAGIWKELIKKTPIDIYRRNLQTIYTEHLIRQVNIKNQVEQISQYDSYLFSGTHMFTDVLPIIKDHLRGLLAKINQSLPAYSDKMSRLHLIDIRDRIKTALFNTQNNIPLSSTQQKEKNNDAFKSFFAPEDPRRNNFILQQKQKGCWDDDLLWEDKKNQISW